MPIHAELQARFDQVSGGMVSEGCAEALRANVARDDVVVAFARPEERPSEPCQIVQERVPDVPSTNRIPAGLL